jgi:hypothetical protein
MNADVLAYHQSLTVDGTLLSNKKYCALESEMESLILGKTVPDNGFQIDITASFGISNYCQFYKNGL